MLVFDQLKKNDAQLRLLALLILGGLFILFAGLWWVQIVQGSRYQASLETQSLRTVRIPAVRGKIFDRNGIALAENRPSYNVKLYLEELSPAFRKEFDTIRPRRVVTNNLPFWKDWLGFNPVKTEFVPLTNGQKQVTHRNARYRVANGIVRKVSDVVKSPLPLDYTNFSRHFDLSRALPYTIASNLSPAQLACFAEQAVNLPALELEVQSVRHYPFGNTAAHVLGYVKRQYDSVNNEQSYYDFRLQDFKGMVGIEGNHDPELRGAAGEKTVVVNNLGYRQSETVTTPIEPGKNIYLTLDLKIQQAAETSLRAHAGPGGKAAVVVMDVESGDVLALVSVPFLDPNDFAKGISTDKYRQLQELTAEKNRATFEIYQAGSIFKTIVALAALETPEARFNPNELYHVDPDPQNSLKGAIFVGRTKIKDTVTPGDYDLERALAHSSNSYFVALGLRPGVFARVLELGRRLHLGERMKLPLMQESAGHFPNAQTIRKDWYDGKSAQICIGQGEMDTTPMQMAVMTCALANGGKVLTPRLVSRLESQDPASVEPPKVFPSHQVRDRLGVSARSMGILHNAMRAETEKTGGTGFHAFDPYYRSGGTMRVCGKTGTAQDDLKKKNATWFISFAPYERPRFAVVVMVENGQSGGTTCAPVARDIYMALEKLGKPVDPTQTASTR